MCAGSLSPSTIWLPELHSSAFQTFLLVVVIYLLVPLAMDALIVAKSVGSGLSSSLAMMDTYPGLVMFCSVTTVILMLFVSIGPLGQSVLDSTTVGAFVLLSVLALLVCTIGQGYMLKQEAQMIANVTLMSCIPLPLMVATMAYQSCWTTNEIFSKDFLPSLSLTQSP